jgi:hypothetical protein
LALQLDEWLGHPAVQAGVLPFAVALAVGAPLARTRWLALAQALGIAACATLALGWSLESLTSTRKLALAGIASLALCVLLELARDRTRAARLATIVLLAAASVWVLWRVLAQKEMLPAAAAGLLAAAYVAWQLAAVIEVSADPVRGSAAGTVLAFATGGLAILGATALLGVLSIAAGSAALAILLIQVVRNAPAPGGRSICVPAAAIAALAAPAAVMAAELAWYTLLPLLLVAPATLLASSAGTRSRAAVACAAAIVPAIAALLLAWFRPLT